ncbi:hypothetical protein HDV05_007418 [Chytridiales sp. JEL 0842]|nr:hypothetical protein HDV05_007418 [Chytridiales sp. JEL 0842]
MSGTPLIQSIGLSVLIVALAVGVALFKPIGTLLEVGGIYPSRSITAASPSSFASKCKPIPEFNMKGCESFAIHQASGIAYLACDESSDRVLYWPPLNRWDLKHSGSGRLYTLDIKTLKVTQLDTPKLPLNLSTQGMGIYSHPDSPNTITLTVINHHPLGSRIEIFEHEQGTNVATHIESVVDPKIVSPNAVVPVGKKSFYVTNDHTLSNKGALRALEELSFIPFGNVLYRDEKGRLREVLKGIQIANGIAVSADMRTVYVASTLGGTVYVYERKPSTGGLTQRDHLYVGLGVDNLFIHPSTHTLYGASVGNVPDYLQHVSNVSHPCPSVVFKMGFNTGEDRFYGKNYKKDIVFQDTGKIVSAAATVGIDLKNKKTVLSGVMRGVTLKDKRGHMLGPQPADGDDADVETVCHLVRIPFRGKVSKLERTLTPAELNRSVAWFRHQCADQEHIPENTVLLFKLPPSINIDYTLSQQFLSHVPSKLQKLQFESPDRVESLVPGGRWLQNPFERLLDHKEQDDSKQRIELLAVIVEDTDDHETIDDPLPSYTDVEKVPIAPVVSDLSKELNDIAIACLESHLPANHSAQTAQVFNLDQQKPSLSIPKPKLVGLAKTPPYCVIREDDLNTLYNELKFNRSICIIGEMGLGKTSLATQYARKHQDDYEWIFFVSCVTAHDCIEGFRNLLDATGSEIVSSEILPTASDIRSAALRWLKSNNNYLLIIDNADDLDLVKPLFEKSEYRIGGSVMITSRNIESAAWASQAFFGGERKVNTLPISVWSRLDTITYLKQRIPFLNRLLSRKEELESLNDICENYLNDYPIIVEQFASLMVQLGGQSSLKTMKSNLESAGWSRLLDTAGNMGMDSFAKLFHFSLESLSAKDPVGPVAVLMICLIGTFAPSPLPYSVFLKSFELLKNKLPPKFASVSMNDCLRALRSSSMIKTTSEMDDIRIHAAFHQVALKVGWRVLEESFCIVTEIGLTKENVVDICWSATSSLIPQESIFGSNSITVEMTNDSTIMAPHLLHLSSHSERQALPYAPCLERTGWILNMRHHYEASHTLLHRALDLRVLETGSRNSLQVADILEALSDLQRMRGDLKPIDSMLDEAFKIKENICGTRRATPLISTFEKLVWLRRAQARYSEAVDVGLEALSLIAELKGDNKNVESADVQMIVGESLVMLGRYEMAREMFDAALETYQAVGNRLSVAEVMDHIGSMYFDQFDSNKAIEKYLEARRMYLEIFKSHKNESIANNTNCLAVAYYSLGLYHKALTYFQHYIDIASEINGSLVNFKVARVYTNMAMCLWRMGQYDNALSRVQVAQTILIEIGLSGSFKIGEVRLYESRILTELGSLDKALDSINKALDIFEATFQTRSNFHYLSALNWRGRIKRLSGDLKGAREDIEACLNGRVEFFKTKEDRWVAETRVELGCLLRAEGRLEEACQEIRDAREIHSRTLPKRELFENVNSSLALGLVYKDLGNVDDAKSFIEEGLGILYLMFGREFRHPLIQFMDKTLKTLQGN